MSKLNRQFYLRPATNCVTDFLGKVLVHQTPQGRVSGIVCDVEAYPAFIDEAHHSHKPTPRTGILWGEGGHAYVYLIYGMWHQFSAVVNKEGIPDVVFIRGVIPTEGIEIMRQQWEKERGIPDLANSPGKLCRSFLITKKHYGIDLVGNELYFEDGGIEIPKEAIKIGKRIGINPKRKGSDSLLRFCLDKTFTENLRA